MSNKLAFIELTDRAEAYFDDELVYSRIQYKNCILKFTEPEFTEQFVKEAKAVKERGHFKYEHIVFEIQPDERYVKLS